LEALTVLERLKAFEVRLSAAQFDKIAMYLALLLRWNRAINLTSVREPGEIVTRHFGESLYLTRLVNLRGTLLDVGSGAGFPGLVLKIAVPDLNLVLLEPTAKKRAFLKEVARECCLMGIEIRPERVEEFCRTKPSSADVVTIRAVGSFGTVLGASAECLTPGGALYVWLTRSQAERLSAECMDLTWMKPVPIPLSRDRAILCGTHRSAGQAGRS